jgi:hypothetical protein
MKTITKLGIFERKPKWKNYRHLTTSDRESAKYRQAYPSAPSARASSRLTSSQDLDRSFEVPAPVLEKEPSVFLPVGDYEIRRSLMRVRELFTIFGGACGRKVALSRFRHRSNGGLDPGSINLRLLQPARSQLSA